MNQLTDKDIFSRFTEVDAPSKTLEEFWIRVLPEIPLPDREQWCRWNKVFKTDEAPLRHAITCAARRLTQKPFNDPMHPVQFISSVALSHFNTKRLERKRAA